MTVRSQGRGLLLTLCALLAIPLAAAPTPAQHPGKELPLRPNDIPQHVAFSPDSRSLAVLIGGCEEERSKYRTELTLFDLAAGKEVRRVEVPGKANPRTAFFSDDGRLLATASFGRGITVWDVDKWKVA